MSSIDVTEILRASSSGHPPPAKKARQEHSNNDANPNLPSGASRDDLLAALEEDAGQAVTVDEAFVKKYTSQLEKKALKNREMRIKHSDDAKKFMDSEIELDTAIQELHSLATQPDLYGYFIETGGPTILLSLLSHENTDIVGATISLLQELTDVDVLNEGDEGALELIDCLMKGRIIETFVTCFEKFDENKKDDADALHGALSVVENMIEVRKEMGDECVNQGVFMWLLKRACQKSTMDANKEYASELLAIMLQTSEVARKKLTEKLDGVDMLLRALAYYKRHDPASPTEKEHMENMFNALCAALIWPYNREKFLEGEGLQLMNLMLREKKQSRNSALKVLDHAVAGPEGKDNCNKFVEILGLRTLFPLFMKTPAVTKKKSKDHNPDEHEEHVCSVLGALFRSCDEISRDRMLNKFIEHEHEKVDRAIELFIKYSERMAKFDVKQAKVSEASDNEQEDEDEKYFTRLDAGLFTLQTVSLILLDVCANGYSCLQRASKLFSMKLKQEKVSRVLLPIVVEYQQNLGTDAQEESRRIDVLIDKLTNLEKELSSKMLRMSAPCEGVEIKRQRLDSTQNIDDTVSIEAVEIANADPAILPFARLRTLQSFVSQCELWKNVTVCGRSPDTDVITGDHRGNPPWVLMISKKHFEIIRDSSKSGIFIKDISLNGTFINSEKLPKGEPIEIKYGDVISLPSSTGNCDTFLFSNLSAEAVYPSALTNKYIMTGVTLGKGGYGHVELARERKNCDIKYAVKELRKDPLNVNCNRRVCKAKDIKNEVRLMMELDHPNIVRLMDFIDIEDSSYIILEFVGGGELFEKIIEPRWEARGLGESMARFYAYQLISAVQYLHSHGVAHRDIKPENILLVDKNDYTIAKLSDFGLAKSRTASTMKTYCGTPNYIAPEIIDDDRTPYRECVDIWSLGVVLFTTYSGYPPFSNEYDDMPLKDQIKEGRLILLQHWINISERDQVAIRRMLSVDPLRRPTAKELLSMEWMHTPEATKAKQKVAEYRKGFMEDNREETEETAGLFKQPNSSRKRVHSDNGLPLDKDKNVGIAARLRQEGCSVNQNGWSSNELSALYTLIKQFGTGDSALEFVSACGLNRSYEEVAEKVAEIRELSLLYKAEKAKEQRKEFEEVGEQGLAHVLERFPIEPLTKSTHGHWNAAALAVTSHFRGYNHSAVKTAITNAFDQIPNSKITNALATESQLTKAESCKMDVNFEKIRNFLSKATFRTPDSSDLNSLECSILLKIIDELWIEGYNSTNIKEKAILRGILSIFKDKSENDNIYTYVDFPCDELSATQMYIDPLRSREWNIPNESRKITRNDVDAIRMNPIDGDYLEEDERDLNIPIVHIEPSEVNSSKYPPNSFIGVHALKNKESSKAETFVIEDALNAIPDEEHTDVQETKVILQRL